MKIGNRIKELRKSKGLTQKQLAEKVGVSVVSITRYETDNREPNIETLKRIAGALEVTINDLTELGNEYIRAVSLSDTYYNSVMKWSEDRFFSGIETICIREHFSELLLRYKRLIESFSGTECRWRDEKESYSRIYKNRENPLSDTAIKEMFLKQELESYMNDLENCVKAFPNQMVQRGIELLKDKDNEGVDTE